MEVADGEESLLRLLWAHEGGQEGGPGPSFTSPVIRILGSSCEYCIDWQSGLRSSVDIEWWQNVSAVAAAAADGEMAAVAECDDRSCSCGCCLWCCCCSCEKDTGSDETDESKEDVDDDERAAVDGELLL